MSSLSPWSSSLTTISSISLSKKLPKCFFTNHGSGNATLTQPPGRRICFQQSGRHKMGQNQDHLPCMLVEIFVWIFLNICVTVAPYLVSSLLSGPRGPSDLFCPYLFLYFDSCLGICSIVFCCDYYLLLLLLLQVHLSYTALLARYL